MAVHVHQQYTRFYCFATNRDVPCPIILYDSFPIIAHVKIAIFLPGVAGNF